MCPFEESKFSLSITSLTVHKSSSDFIEMKYFVPLRVVGLIVYQVYFAHPVGCLSCMVLGLLGGMNPPGMTFEGGVHCWYQK